jgi:hypothetical protein
VIHNDTRSTKYQIIFTVFSLQHPLPKSENVKLSLSTRSFSLKLSKTCSMLTLLTAVENVFMRFKLTWTRKIKKHNTFGLLQHTDYPTNWVRRSIPVAAASCLLGLRVRIPLEVWMSVSCECCVLSGRGLCDGLIPHPEEFYRACACVFECDELYL